MKAGSEKPKRRPTLPAEHPMHELAAKGRARLADPFADAREGDEAAVRAACALFAYHRDRGMPLSEPLLTLVTEWLRRIGKGDPFLEAFVGKRQRGGQPKKSEAEMHREAMIGYEVACAKDTLGNLEAAAAEVAERHDIEEKTARNHYTKWMLGRTKKKSKPTNSGN